MFFPIAVSGEVPEEPVVSRKSGFLFEKRLIEQHVSDYGKCPITGEPMTMDDIIPAKSGKMVKPRPIAAASVPGMLGMFQIEWDSLMLSNFALEKQLHTARQELSHALYQHDAACRVITRLRKERDEARSLLAQPERQSPEDANGKRAAEDEGLGPDGKKLKAGISSDVVAELSDCNDLLSKQRKKRTIPQTLAPIDEVERYNLVSSHPLHTTSKPGILSIDIHHSKDIIATGGIDSNVVVFDHSSSEIISTLSCHSKKVTSVKIVPQDDPFVVTGSADTTVRLWQGSEDGNYECKHILKDHHKEVQAVTIHPNNKYFATAALDKTWCFCDLSTGLRLMQVTDPSESIKGYTSAAFHPDGPFLGTGTNSLVQIWDLKSQTTVATLDGHLGAVTSISFSENGFVLAAAADDGVKLWDLRTLKSFRCYPPSDPSVTTNSVSFDHSGRYLAIGGADTRVYKGVFKAESDCIKILPDLSGRGKVTSVRFGPDAKYIAVALLDHNLRIFGLPAAEAPEDS